MYLSRLILNLRSRQVRSELSNPYELHRTLMRAFPGQSAGGPGRVLFRQEPPLRYQPDGLILLVQSEKKPDWSWHISLNGYLLETDTENPAVKPFNPVFLPGQRLLFRLRANPTVKRNGKRWGLVKEEEQKQWLIRKGEQGGFTVLGVNISSEGKQRGVIRRPDRSPHHLTFLSVRFDGLLQVTDPDRFMHTLEEGIGSGKGLGFGLLSVAPL